MTPNKIPVNVLIAQPSVGPDSLFEVRPRPRVVLISPERPPMTGLVETSIRHDVSRPRGVAVDVRGAMGADIHPDILEEAARRGGAFGIPGRLWISSHTSS